MNLERLNTVASRIKFARKSAGLSQSELAKLMDASTVYVSQIERGQSKCSEKFISKVAYYTRTTEEWIANGKGPIELITRDLWRSYTAKHLKILISYLMIETGLSIEKISKALETTPDELQFVFNPKLPSPEDNSKQCIRWTDTIVSMIKNQWLAFNEFNGLTSFIGCSSTLAMFHAARQLVRDHLARGKLVLADPEFQMQEFEDIYYDPDGKRYCILYADYLLACTSKGTYGIYDSDNYETLNQAVQFRREVYDNKAKIVLVVDRRIVDYTLKSIESPDDIGFFYLIEYANFYNSTGYNLSYFDTAKALEDFLKI